MRGAFLRGAFTAEAARGSAAVLAAYGLGLAPMVLIRSAVASFQSRGDTTTPMLCFFAGLLVNLALKLALYRPLGPAGLAMATADRRLDQFRPVGRCSACVGAGSRPTPAARECRGRRCSPPARPLSPRPRSSSGRPPSAACRCCATNSTSLPPDCSRSWSMRGSRRWRARLGPLVRAGL